MSKEDRSKHQMTAEQVVENVFLKSLKVNNTDPKEAQRKAKLAAISGKMHDTGKPYEK